MNLNTRFALGLIVGLSAIMMPSAPAAAQSTGTVVFDNLVSAPNVPSQGFQCCATSEIGDAIALAAETPRRAGFATVLMSSWSLHSNYPDMSSSGYTHPITLAIYANAADARAHAPLASVTQNFVIPWRPEADPTCPGGTAWRHANHNCYNGLAFNITFDLRSLDLTLPEQFIYGVAYNTNTWGYEPIGAPGPYESLNVGLATVSDGIPPTEGTDVDDDVVYWNTAHAAFYTDGGATGVGVLRPDTGWTGFAVSVQFTTFGFPTTAESCKNGAWQNLARADVTPFRNQGACISYVNAGQ